MLEFKPAVGVGVSDIQHAVRAEVERILKETKGDELAQTKLIHGMLRTRGLLTEADLRTVNKLAQIGIEAGQGKRDAKAAYFESRDLYNGLLARGDASPVALAMASSAVGSFSVTEGTDGSPGVVFKKSNGAWEKRGTAVGATVGAIWGPLGAGIGAAVGGAVGAAVDECLD
jgi:hypothetical protein